MPRFLEAPTDMHSHVSSSSISRASPKSLTLQRFSLETKTFRAATSRWMNPSECTCARPSQQSPAHSSFCSIDTSFFSRKLLRAPYSINSSTTYTGLPTVITPTSCTTKGLSNCAITAASSSSSCRSALDACHADCMRACEYVWVSRSKCCVNTSFACAATLGCRKQHACVFLKMSSSSCFCQKRQ